MADGSSAPATPIPEEIPKQAVESPKVDEATSSPQSGDDQGKDVSFGTFLTVGSATTKSNITVTGYNSLSGKVEALRRAGNGMIKVEIPYAEYKELIKAQKASDVATGRKQKKNLSKAIRGFYRKSVAIDGKSSQVIGYDGQTDEVLVNDEKGQPHWMKSGEMLSRTAVFSTPDKPVTNTAAASSSQSTPSKTSTAPQEQIHLQAPKTVPAESTTITAPTGVKQSSEEDDDYSIKTEVERETKPGSGQQHAPKLPSATATISGTREALKQQRASSESGSVIQSATAIVAAVAATIPSSNTNASAVVAAAQNTLQQYAVSEAKRENQLHEISGKITEASDRVNDLQLRSHSASKGGNIAQAQQLQSEMKSAQTERDSLLQQQMNLQVVTINEESKARQIGESVQQLTPNNEGVIPEEKIKNVEKTLPRSVLKPPPAFKPSTSIPKPKKPQARPSTNTSTNTTTNSGSRPVQTVKPALRALPISNEANRAVEFGAGQERSRGESMQDNSIMTDSSSGESMGAYDMGQKRSVAIPKMPMTPSQSTINEQEEREKQSDDIGQSEKEGQDRMSAIHRGTSGEPDEAGEGATSMQEPTSESSESQEPSEPSSQPTGTERQQQNQMATAAKINQQKTVAKKEQDEKKKNRDEAGAMEKAESASKMLKKAKLWRTRLMEAYETAEGSMDIIGIVEAIAVANIRQVLTFFKKDLPFLPQSEYPYECAAVGCLDTMVCMTMLVQMMIPIIILAAIIAAVYGATHGLSDMFSDETVIMNALNMIH